MNYLFYSFVIFSVFANFHVKALPPKNEAGTSSGGQSDDSLEEQMKKLLENDHYMDVDFRVGKGDKMETVSAHRAILSSASDVFKEMFIGEQNSKNAIGKDNTTTNRLIFVPDIEIGAFKAMISFIYTKHLNGLNANNLFGILESAVKYNITGLVNECSKFPIEKLPNVFVAFQQARFMKLELRSNEIEIWKAALRWADEKCRQKGIECSAENRREMLGQALFNIRFPLMSAKDFTKSVVSTGVLTTEEMFGVYQYYCHPELNDGPGLFPLAFPKQRRYKESKIEMEIEKVSEFAVAAVGSERYSDAVEIGGFSWKIWAQIKKKNENNEKLLGFFLYNDSRAKGNWSCKCSAILRIVSQKNGIEDLTKTFKDTIIKKGNNSGFYNFISFKELMDPSKGFYNKEEDKVKLVIDVTAVKDEKHWKLFG
ncbi:hypothetical protein niasHT_028751 [Heterodera trifolii]|uniref:BTB domain-containing protein n=1 Tax=Heterodera trifolii TaxID=157864 RepID=A0ABD2KQL5_9BILA